MKADANSSGGLLLCRPAVPLQSGQGISLLSDLHIGSPQTDEKLIVKELELARKRNDRILINGDIFDGILASDSKRFRPNAVASWLHGVNDIVGKALERAGTLLAPYADLIDMIGIGNHEASLEKYHSFCPVSALIEHLNRFAYQTIFFGGYTGIVRYKVARSAKQRAGHRAGGSLTIFYWHGTGGGSSLSGALGEFGTKGTFVEGADVHWHAHKHIRLACPVERLSCSASHQGPQARTLWLVRTGAYMRPYRVQSQKSWSEQGRNGNYAADSLLPPAGRGGVRLVAGDLGKHRVEFIN